MQGPGAAAPTRVDVPEAVEALARDGLVAFPTETVWGLAARAESPHALARLRDFKGRDADKPVALLVDRPERLREIGVVMTPCAQRLVETFWPGPLTLVAECRRVFAPGVAAPDGSVGLRCSPHPVAAALAREALERGLGPLTATSLNRSGEAPARHVEEALAVAARDPRLAVVVGEADGRPPSTVVDARGAVPQVLREGTISRAEVMAGAAPVPKAPETDRR